MNKMYKYLFFCFLSFACGEEKDRQEVVDKLRAVGVEAEPGIVSYELKEDEKKSVALNAYFLLPKDSSITSSKPFEDEKAQFSIPIDIVIKGSDPLCNEKIDEKFKDLGPLKLCSVQAESEIPKIFDPTYFGKLNGIIRLRYGFDVRSKEEKEFVVGDYLVVLPGTYSLKWKKHQIQIEAPLVVDAAKISSSEEDKKEKVKRFELKAKIIKADNFTEEIKVGWFVSGGKVKNFRALETEWEFADTDTGEYTLLIALYGVKSRFFAFDARKVIIK